MCVSDMFEFRSMIVGREVQETGGKWWLDCVLELGFGPNLWLSSLARDTPIEDDVSPR